MFCPISQQTYPHFSTLAVREDVKDVFSFYLTSQVFAKNKGDIVFLVKIAN